MCVAALLVLAVVAGWTWQAWADPARWEVTEAGAVLTQRAAAAQFRVELVFVAVGVVLCSAWAAVTALVCRPLGWRLVPYCAAATGLAAVLAWRIGVLLGPPDPASVDALAVGQTFPDQLAVQSVPAFLLWPTAAVAGLLVVFVVTARSAPSPHPSSR